MDNAEMKNMLCLSPVIDPVGVVNVEIYMVHVEIGRWLENKFSDQLSLALALAKPNIYKGHWIFSLKYSAWRGPGPVKMPRIF